MEKVRINNDLLIKYTVLRDGQPESFAGATDITVTVTNEAYKKAIPNTFDIVGNVVNISIDAADFNLCGKYRVTLKYVRGNDIEIDALAFEGVQYTSLTGGTEIVGVEVVTVNISCDIGIAIPDNNKIDLDGLNSNIDKLHFKPDTLVQLAEVGDVRYSPENRTLEVKVSDTVSIQLGQEMQTRVKNDTGVQINNGQMVYIDSASGANPLAKIASTTDANIAQRTFGMATENIASNGFGAITTEGLVRDVNTSSFAEGAMLWLSTNGSVTTTEPVAPTPKISVGMVLRSNVANGVIYVKIRAISRNQKLSDVYAPTLTGGDVLRWNSTTLRFETFNVTTALAGKADLVGGKVPTSQLPSYVDDVQEYANLAAFPATGETGKIYVALNTNLTYRWSGTAYVEISKSLALGETSDTAYRGDRGKTAYDHSQATGNPHGTTAAQIPNTPAGTVAATTVQGAINELASDIVQVETDLNGIAELVKYTGQWYGVEWDTTVSSSALTRIGNMSLHYLLPIQSKMRRCLLLDNGTVNYYLHPTDSTKKEDGSNAILDGTDGQVMVEIPEFYYEFQSNLTKNRVLLSEYPILKNKSNKVYISAYEAALDRTNLKLSSVVNNTAQFRGGNNAAANDGTSKTLLGRPVTATSLTQFRTYARNRGSINWNCNAYLVQKILYWLIAVEYGNFNNQLPFNPALTSEGYRQGGLGNGVTDLNDSKWNSFNGYYPFIPCGHTNSLGNSTGIVPYQMPAEYDPVILTTNVPSYRGVENPFGHLWKWTDGCKCNIQSDASGGISEFYVCNNPTNYQDVDYVNYVLRGLIPRGNGYIKSLIIGDSGEIMPLSVGGSSTTYMCDYFYTSIPASGVAQRGVVFGGAANNGAFAGVGCSSTDTTATAASARVGSRLCYII